MLREGFVITQVLPYLLSYFTCFVMLFVRHFYFHFRKNLTIGFAIGRAKSRGADIIINFSKWVLQKILTIFQRYIIAETGSLVFFFLDSFFIQPNSIALVSVCVFFLVQTTLSWMAFILYFLSSPISNSDKNLFICSFLMVFYSSSDI